MKSQIFKEFEQIICDIVPPEQSNLPSLDLKDQELRRINQKIQEKELPILYRYTAISLNELKNLMSESVYLAAAQWMNDTFEGAVFDHNHDNEATQRSNRRMQTEIYLKCFSVKCGDILMWSHYGDANKGICVGYNLNNANNEIKDHLYPVQYSNVRFSCNNIETVREHPFFYLRKSKDWEYEEEFRLIYRKRNIPNSNQQLKLDCISEVIFGLRTDPVIREIITALVEKKNKDRAREGKSLIKLYNTIQKEDSFLLEREETCHD